MAFVFAMLQVSEHECTHDYKEVTYGDVSMGAFYLLRWEQLEKEQMVQLRKIHSQLCGLRL